jgi:hypothetical protein
MASLILEWAARQGIWKVKYVLSCGMEGRKLVEMKVEVWKEWRKRGWQC